MSNNIYFLNTSTLIEKRLYSHTFNSLAFLHAYIKPTPNHCVRTLWKAPNEMQLPFRIFNNRCLANTLQKTSPKAFSLNNNKR